MNDSDRFAFLMSIIFGVVMIIIPFYMIYILNKKFEKLHKKRT
jgi:hypothetical protein